MKNKKTVITIILSSILLLYLAGCDKQPAAREAVQPTPSVNQLAPAAESPGAASQETQPNAPGASGQPPANQGAVKIDAAAVLFTNVSDGWIGGKGFIYHTADGGQHWEKRYSGTENIGAFTFLKGNSKTGWAYQGTINGSYAVGNPNTKQNLLMTSDGGATWNVISSSAALGKEVHFISEREGFSGNKMTVDGGKTWTGLPVPSELSGEPYFMSVKEGWAVTNSGSDYQIEQTTDGGQTWKPAYKHAVGSIINGAVVRSGGKDDVWVHLIGDSGMMQTSHALLHTKDSGHTWTPVVAHSTAGGGPAPGYAPGAETGPPGPGTKPDELAVVSPQAAVMLGVCPPCGDAGELSVGWTNDGGQTWTNSSQQLPGQDGMLSFVNEREGWLLTHAVSRPAVLYKTNDGGKQWNKVYSFGG